MVCLRSCGLERALYDEDFLGTLRVLGRWDELQTLPNCSLITIARKGPGGNRVSESSTETNMPDYRRYFIPGGTYFFTVVTYKRFPFFRTPLAISLLRDAWRKTHQEAPFINYASVLLHNHFHCLWTLPPLDDNYSMRLKRLKDRFTSSWLCEGGYEVPVTASQKKRGHRGIWQIRFWEHTIRDERDFDNHFNYIHFNPVKHGYCRKAADWPYSTFHRWVTRGYYDPLWGSECPDAIKDCDWD
jgi:putative transposase